MGMVEAIQKAGVVGAGGAGFPTHVKLNAKAEYLIINAAECEPLIETDKYLCRTFPERIVSTVLKMKEHLGAAHAVIALKGKYIKEIEALEQAITAAGADVAIIDTAGRLHNKVNLMNELTKIRNVMAKVVPGAPHEVLLVLDGSTGQNAFEQARQFTAATQVTSLAITKLDGTAKGGVVIGISDQFKIPIRYIGVGEGIDHLQVFDKKAFVDALFHQ